ncbi:MAG: hypothetical protein H6684_06935 [Deltaproteobacteria bacterium]|nr:hypothetical protein [Deltaproteobacteria bacterium]MCB9479522.1 hypothetical protein [Deltaproteobacteria bacterium]MCB9488448.1 hypothetical protein [Deltaproteobacteria bacterium]
MKRLFVIGLSLVFALALAGPAAAMKVTNVYGGYYPLNGDRYQTASSVRIFKLEAQFDSRGLTELHYRIIPEKGTVQVMDVQVLSGKKVKYKLSDTRTLGDSLHLLEGIGGHQQYERRQFFPEPVEGFDYHSGKIKFVFSAEGRMFEVVWTMLDNSVMVQDYETE